jgi:hypothetical protein
MGIDQSKLEAFMGQAVGDLGAAISGLMVHIGDELGCTRRWRGRGRSARPRSPSGPAATSATSGNGSPIRRPAGT